MSVKKEIMRIFSIHKNSKKYLRFIIDGIIYEFMALPMCYTSSPQVFTRLAEFLTALCRRHKVRIFGSIDMSISIGAPRSMTCARFRSSLSCTKMIF